MTPIVWTYISYLIISVALTIWVARTLFKNGRIFLVDSFLGNEPLADSINHLLVVGFYLINFGYVTMALKSTDKPVDLQGVLETLSGKIGWVLLILGGMHFFNLFIFQDAEARASAERSSARTAAGLRPGGHAMRCLYVLYDQECSLCLSCGRWLMRQAAYIQLRFIPLQSPEIAQRFPGLTEWDGLDLREKLVVVNDEGAVYQGQYAWIMCLYALRDYREWSQRLAEPLLLPFARRVCELVSRNRLAISHFLQAPTNELRNTLAATPPPVCNVGTKCD